MGSRQRIANIPPNSSQDHVRRPAIAGEGGGGNGSEVTVARAASIPLAAAFIIAIALRGKPLAGEAMRHEYRLYHEHQAISQTHQVAPWLGKLCVLNYLLMSLGMSSSTKPTKRVTSHTPEAVWRKERTMAVKGRAEEHRTGDRVSKVPQVTLAFWIIKILATTVGETGGDALSMTLHLG